MYLRIPFFIFLCGFFSMAKAQDSLLRFAVLTLMNGSYIIKLWPRPWAFTYFLPLIMGIPQSLLCMSKVL